MAESKPTITLEGARNNLHLSQEDTAKALGISTNSYREYEKYHRVLRLDKAYKFADLVSQPMESIIFLPADYASYVARAKSTQEV